MLPDESDISNAFERRSFALSEAGGYERSFDARQQEAMTARMAEKAEAYVQGLGLGDTIPSPHEYDYGAMLADGFHPKPDGAGRLPLPPQYWKPGMLVVRGVDLATGERVSSGVSLEDMVIDGAQDEGEALMTEPLTPEDFAGLGIPERNSLEAWLGTRGMQVVAGPAQQMSPAKDAKAGPRPQQKEGAGDVGMAMMDMLAGALKGGVAQTLGLPGDVESLVRMLTNTGDEQTMSGLVTGEKKSRQVLPTTEQVSAALPPVVPNGDPSRQHSADTFEALGQFAGLPNAVEAVKAAAPMVKKGAAAVGAAMAGDSARKAP